jgi:hypothetical protein
MNDSLPICVDLIIQGEGQMFDRVPRVARIAPRVAFADCGTFDWIQSLLREVSIGNVKSIEHFQNVVLQTSMGRANSNNALMGVPVRIHSANNWLISPTLRIQVCALMFIIAIGFFPAVRAAPQNALPPISAGTYKEFAQQRVFGFRRSYYVHVPAGRLASQRSPWWLRFMEHLAPRAISSGKAD